MWLDVFVVSGCMMLWSLLVELFPEAKVGLCEWPIVVATIYTTYCLWEFPYLSGFTLACSLALVLPWVKLTIFAWIVFLLAHILLWMSMYHAPFDHMGSVFRTQVKIFVTASASCIAFVLGGLEQDILGVFVVLTYVSFLVCFGLWAKQELDKKFSFFVGATVSVHVIQIILSLFPHSLLPRRIVGIPTLVWYGAVVFYLGYTAINVKKVSEQAVV